MASSWHQSLTLCCLSLLTGTQIILGGVNRSPTPSLPSGVTVLMKKVTPTKVPARIFSTSTKPTEIRFGNEDLEEKIEPNLEKRLWGKGEKDKPPKLGKII